MTTNTPTPTPPPPPDAGEAERLARIAHEAAHEHMQSYQENALWSESDAWAALCAVGRQEYERVAVAVARAARAELEQKFANARESANILRDRLEQANTARDEFELLLHRERTAREAAEKRANLLDDCLRHYQIRFNGICDTWRAGDNAAVLEAVRQHVTGKDAEAASAELDRLRAAAAERDLLRGSALEYIHPSHRISGACRQCGLEIGEPALQHECRPEATPHAHVWGTDGMHSNEYCKVCFVNKPKGTTPERTENE